MQMLILIYAIGWIVFVLYLLRAQLSIKSLSHFDLKGNPTQSLSVLIAVKDGEDQILPTLKKLQEVGSFLKEIIVVNDRSRDNTNEILRKFQRNCLRLKVVEVFQVPEGWLGKVNALSEGMRFATSDFVLLMDADVHVSKEVLGRSVLLAENLSLDHLAILPEVSSRDYGTDVVMATSLLLFTASARPWLSNTERPLQSVKGVGAFNLVRREKFEASEQFDWLKMETADDVALAQLIVRHGGKSLLLKADDNGPSLDWYEDIWALVRGLEKNIVGGFTNYRWSYLFLFVAASSLVSLIPMVAFFVAPPLFALFLGVHFIGAILIKKTSGLELSKVFFLPLGITGLGLILLRAFLLCINKQGITWSGTFYKLSDLKKGSRVKLGF